MEVKLICTSTKYLLSLVLCPTAQVVHWQLMELIGRIHQSAMTGVTLIRLHATSQSTFQFGRNR
jgi:hypothetical protein